MCFSFEISQPLLLSREVIETCCRLRNRRPIRAAEISRRNSRFVLRGADGLQDAAAPVAWTLQEMPVLVDETKRHQQRLNVPDALVEVLDASDYRVRVCLEGVGGTADENFARLTFLLRPFA